jgi:hypothetical protein
MRRVSIAALAAAIAMACPAPIVAQIQPKQGESVAKDAPPVTPVASYANTAKLALQSPIVADATVRNATKISGPQAAGLAPNQVRLYVTADVGSLIRGKDGVPPRIGYLIDLPLDWRGRPPQLKKQRVLLFARRVANAPDQLQLTAPDAQQAWTPELDARVKAVLREALATDAPPEITGVGNAFHVPGALPGEGETQIFLTTKDNRPVSLSILSRPGEDKRWAVALSEIVDDAAAAPKRDTLLWYRLACFLPRDLSQRSLEQNDEANAGLAREDYQFVLQQLGTCDPSH